MNRPDHSPVSTRTPGTSQRQLLLIDFPWTREKDPPLSLGHASLLAALGQVPGLQVDARSIPVNGSAPDARQLAAELLSGVGPGTANLDIALGAYVWSEWQVRKLLVELRDQGFRGRIILGGPQVSYAGPEIEELYPEVDVFVRGYGEDALVALMSRPGRPAITGVHYRGEADAQAQAPVALEELPSPWSTGVAKVEGQRFVRWETQRGCPYRCSFCQHREPGEVLKRRALGRERIMTELELFCRGGVEEIAVLDPIFNLAPHATEVLNRFTTLGYRGRLSLQCRAETLLPEFLDAAAKLEVTLECGLQTIHEQESKAIHRRNRIDRVDSALADVRRRGINHEVSLIYGLPRQTLRSFEESVGWCLDRRVPVIKAFPLLLLRGTTLEKERDRWGFVESGGATPAVEASDSFTHEEWLEMARLSEALRRTEGRHPEGLEELRAKARGLPPVEDGWRTAPEARAE